MDWTQESVEEQMAYFFIAMEDPDKVGEYIFQCMEKASKGSTRDISAAQAFFLKVTKVMSEIVPEYSLECSAVYMRYVTENFGIPENDIKFK